MALRISYCFKGQPREINYANDKFHDIYEAIAAEEGIDLRAYLAMERQIAGLSKRPVPLKIFVIIHSLNTDSAISKLSKSKPEIRNAANSRRF